MPFWSTNFGNTEELLKDPKRNFRFYINIQGISTENGGAMIWYAKQVNKPTFTLAEATHEYLNHTYYYPGKVSWNPIEITMVDPGGDPDVVATLAGIVSGAGYNLPDTPDAGKLTSMSKQKSVGALGQVKITQVDAEGVMVEEWTLWNAFAQEIDFGGTLAYGNDELTEIKLKLRYDWAELNTATEGSAIVDPDTKFFDISR
tara:strand:- start:11587 stop:12192 length:606 start_codon:yes stop_codon:yes gene_type:complete